MCTSASDCQTPFSQFLTFKVFVKYVSSQSLVLEARKKEKKIAGTVRVREKVQWHKHQIVFSPACFYALLHFQDGSDPLWFEIMTWHRSQLLSHPTSARKYEKKRLVIKSVYEKWKGTDLCFQWFYRPVECKEFLSHPALKDKPVQGNTKPLRLEKTSKIKSNH